MRRPLERMMPPFDKAAVSPGRRGELCPEQLLLQYRAAQSVVRCGGADQAKAGHGLSSFSLWRKRAGSPAVSADEKAGGKFPKKREKDF